MDKLKETFKLVCSVGIRLTVFSMQSRLPTMFITAA